MNQEMVAFRNPGSKALFIDTNTSANYPASLSLNNLMVDAPANSSNQLVLSWAGLSVPLVIHTNLAIGTNGSLASYYSHLRATNVFIYGSALFSDNAMEDFGQLWLRSSSVLNLTSGTMTASMLTFLDTATFTQSGGTHVVQNINLPIVNNPFNSATWSTYSLQGGALVSRQLTLGYAVGPVGYGDGRGTLWQTGGVHTNSGITMQGYYHPGGGTLAGKYLLDGGLLVSSSISSDGGSFVQTGGTNIIHQLNVTGGSQFFLNGGELVTSNTTITVDSYVGGRFVQTGGTHTVQGPLVATKLDLYGGTLRVSSQGAVSNAGTITLSYNFPASICADNVEKTQYLGRLQLYGGTLDLHAPLSPPTKATVFRFGDSHALPWTGQLQISNWGLNPGDHVFFGTNAQALTAAQLARVRFARNNTTYAAALLPTGELVPTVPPPLFAINLGGALVLSWTGGYELVTATNATGPYVLVSGATSPMTNTFSDSQRYFRLRMGFP